MDKVTHWCNTRHFAIAIDQPAQSQPTHDEAAVPRSMLAESGHFHCSDSDGELVFPSIATAPSYFSSSVAMYLGRRRNSRLGPTTSSNAVSTAASIGHPDHLATRYQGGKKSGEVEIFPSHWDDSKMQALSTFVEWSALTVFPRLVEDFEKLHFICNAGPDQQNLASTGSGILPIGPGSQANNGNPTQTGQKRMRGNSQQGSDTVENPWVLVDSRNQRKRQKTAAFACHFYKFNPNKFSGGKYKSCPNAYDGLNRLKQHQKYVHRPLYYCKRCKTIFKSQDDRDSHDGQSLRCVERYDPEFQDLLTTDKQREVLGKKPANTKVTEKDHWYEMWDVYFSGSPRPDSPYKDDVADEVFEFVYFAESRTVDTIQRFRNNYPDLGVDDVTLQLFYQFAIRENLHLFTSQADSYLQRTVQESSAEIPQEMSNPVERESANMFEMKIPTLNSADPGTSPSSGASGLLSTIDLPSYCLDSPLYMKSSQQYWQHQGLADELQPQDYTPKDDDYWMPEISDPDPSTELVSLYGPQTDEADDTALRYRH